MNLKNTITQILSIKKRRASPLIEEGFLVGLSIFCFLLIVSQITGILDWFLAIADDLLKTLDTLK